MSNCHSKNDENVKEKITYCRKYLEELEEEKLNPHELLEVCTAHRVQSESYSTVIGVKTNNCKLETNIHKSQIGHVCVTVTQRVLVHRVVF